MTTDAQSALAQVREALADPMLFDWARDWDRARAIRAFERSCTTANIAAILAHVEAQEAEIERLRAGLQAVSDLIDESHGVAGLHRNGDVAPWGDLRTGGKYEEWLVSFDDALKEQG
jgi:hypothetical protein